MSKFRIATGLVLLFASTIILSGPAFELHSLNLGPEEQIIAGLLFLLGLTFLTLGMREYGGVSIGGVVVLAIGLFMLSLPGLFPYGLPGLSSQLGEFLVFLVGPIVVLAGLIIIAFGLRRHVGVTPPFKTDTLEGVPFLKEENKRVGWTEFSGTIVGKAFEMDVKKSWTRTGQISNYKAGLKVKIFDKEGNPLGVTEAVFKDKDNYKTLNDGDNVWIRGKWRKDGRVDVKEARNLTTRTVVKQRQRFGWVKKVIAIIVVLFVLYFIYMSLTEFLGSLFL